VRVEVAIGDIRQTLADVPSLSDAAVTLAIRATRAAPVPGRITSAPDRLAFGVMEAGGFRSLAELDGRYFSTEVAGGFTGRVIGIGAAAGGATIARFAYAPLHTAQDSSDPAVAYAFLLTGNSRRLANRPRCDRAGHLGQRRTQGSMAELVSPSVVSG
jgi:hypothetical protein